MGKKYFLQFLEYLEFRLITSALFLQCRIFIFQIEIIHILKANE